MSNRSQAILRVRTGCLTCRGRKKKCDEQKPRCRGCTRNHLECSWPTSQDSLPRRGGRQGRNSNAKHYTSRVRRLSDGETDNDPDTDDSQQLQELSTALVHSQRQEEPVFSTLDDLFIFNNDIEPDQEFLLSGNAPFDPGHQPSIQTPQFLPSNPSLLPQLSPETSELLSYYLAKTANSMGNGSIDANPFITQIVPLAFSSELVLQLILTQSAAHRAVMGPDSAKLVAHNYYMKSLGLFRNAVNDFISGSRADGLMLATGALILCFTETAKGDIHGTIFDHLAAANSMLRNLVGSSAPFLTKSLNNFLVEYYTYTATLSMISIDARYSEQLLLASDMEQNAQDLVQLGYVGDLCGCWLQLLLLIPQIFDLGRRVFIAQDPAAPAAPCADQILTFSELHSQILSFSPSSSVSPETSQVSRVFQNAVLIYLLTTLRNTGPALNGKYARAVQSAVRDAIFHLSQIDPVSRINTSLCWPLAVIGSCTDDEHIQATIKQRLQSMLRSITLGNIKETLVLLERIWETPFEQRSPWTICTTMQEHQIWISFA